jgi:hypothetical protein
VIRESQGRTARSKAIERERREFGGREHILEYGIVADFAW